ncbi:helix-turn-helix domain-containing protein [Streptomyces sp. NPDC008317]|uniref:helix-turn-helix domain-containing protein n=1 Tax=Streptomyces sp. NPDC008317 TaxID=3364827 RepID=UPI0036ED9FC9
MTQAPDPVAAWHDLMAALVRRSGLSVRQLAARAGYSSTYCNEATNGTRVPPWPVAEAIITALGDGAEARLPAWRAARQALGMSADTGENADAGPLVPPAATPPGVPGVAAPRGPAEVPPTPPAEAPPGVPATPDPRPASADGPAAPAAGPTAQPAPPGATPAPRSRQRRVLLTASVTAVVLAALGYAAVAFHPTGHRNGAVPSGPGRTPGRSQPDDFPCRATRQYVVTSDGNVLDAHGAPVGDGIHRGDYFDLAPEQPHSHYAHRYYGSVVGRELSGYVDQARIHLSGTVCLTPRR